MHFFIYRYRVALLIQPYVYIYEKYVQLIKSISLFYRAPQQKTFSFSFVLSLGRGGGDGEGVRGNWEWFPLHCRHCDFVLAGIKISRQISSLSNNPAKLISYLCTAATDKVIATFLSIFFCQGQHQQGTESIKPQPVTMHGQYI